MNTSSLYAHHRANGRPSLATRKKGNPNVQEHFGIHTLPWTEQPGSWEPGHHQRLSYYEITWFRSCCGHVTIDSKHHVLKNNAVYCFCPGQVRHFALSQATEGYQLSFSRDFLYIGSNQTKLTSWLDDYGTGREALIIDADADMQRELEDILQKMQREFANYFLLRSEILSGLLNILMIHFSRKLDTGAGNRTCSKEVELVRRFRLLLKEQFITKKQVADYAGDLCVTPNYLNRTVKKITGFTVSHHIQQQIILEAKRQAMHSNTSMKEIAYFLGFDNLAHFSKYFKNNCGMNFTSFRKDLAFAG
jgi:AraC family transcriptional activator of pobA